MHQISQLFTCRWTSSAVSLFVCLFLPGEAGIHCKDLSDEAPAADVLASLSAEIAPVWESLGRRLGLPDSTIDNIKFSLVDTETKQRALKMLMVWRRQNPGSGLKDLAQALTAEELGPLADKYCREMVI